MAGHQEDVAMTKTMDAKEARPKGPPLSTSTSSFEALDPHDPRVTFGQNNSIVCQLLDFECFTQINISAEPFSNCNV